MANLAQTINVLQSMILTQGEKMVVTPTYYVFDMYKVHQNAQLLPLEFSSSQYSYGDESVPQVSASASEDGEGKINVSLCNLDPNSEVHICCQIRGTNKSSVCGSILTAVEMNAHNTFEEPENVKPMAFCGASLAGNVLDVKLPSKSVVVLTIE
jgi:alpha-N-arabinofuranosidase